MWKYSQSKGTHEYHSATNCFNEEGPLIEKQDDWTWKFAVKL